MSDAVTRVRRGFTGGVTVVMVLVVLATACATAGTWAVEAVGEGATEPSAWRPTGLDCATVSACVAVGWPDTPANAPVPAAVGGAGGFRAVAVGGVARLEGVACATATACVGVGVTPTTAGLAPVARHFDGGAWTPLPTPPRRVSAVDCPAADACVAVGQDPRGATWGLTALTWDGAAWADRTPDPGGGSFLAHAVSCSTATDCVAAGNVPFEGAGVASWDGAAWTVQTLGGPERASDYLTDVSCVAAVCVVVGDGNNGGVAYARRGGSWAALPALPVPPEDPDRRPLTPRAVGCTAPDRCVVAAAGAVARILRWDGVAWTATPVPSVGLPANELVDVSCGAGSCVVLGYVLPAPEDLDTRGLAAVAIVETATGWRPVALPPQPRAVDLAAVACPDDETCLAVGEHTIARGESGWQARPALDPTAAPGVRLTDLSCPTAGFCAAIRRASDGARSHDELLAGAGGNLAPVSLPAVPEQFVPGLGVYPARRTLTAVACAAPDACLAVGSYTGDQSVVGVTFVGDGTGWRAADGPVPFGIASLSCWAADGCVAVGQGSVGPGGGGTPGGAPPPDQAARAVAFRWDGRAWTPMPLPDLPDAPPTSLRGVACASPTFCAAVGRTGTASAEGPLAATWDGTAWTVVRPSGPEGTPAGTLAAVACPSPTWCLAVGATGDSRAEPWTLRRPVSFVWNGQAWSAGPAFPVEADAPLPLTDVACSPRRCVAVGEAATVVTYTIS